MAGRLGERARRIAAVALAASFLGAAPAPAEPDPKASVGVGEAAPPAPAAVAVFAPRTSDVLRGVQGGVRIWIVQQLRRGGIPVVEPAHTDAIAARHLGAGRLFLKGEDAPALARETEAGAVLLTHLQAEDGQLELWLRAYDRDGKVLAVGHAAGRLAALGDPLVAAFAPVRAALGAGPGDAEPPWLSELGAYQRGLDRLAGGSLASAWREISGIQSPTADALREDILARSAAPEIGASERSRLASVRGATDPDWLAIRHQLQRERDVNVLLAGAEHAGAGSDPEGALVLFAEAAKKDPTNLDAERGRARMLFALDRPAEAKAAYERVLSRVPDDVEARLALASDQTLPPAEQARLWLRAGEEQSRQLDDQGARASFERAEQLDPAARGATRRNVAHLEETLGNDPDALAAYDEALESDSGDLDALRGLGRMRSRSGDAVAAGAAFDKVLAAKPEDLEALQGLGTALLAQGKAQQAVVPLQKAVALAPRDAGKRTALARALAAAGQSEAALRALDPGQVPLEDRPLVWSRAAEIHAAQGQLVEARVALEQAIALEPDAPALRSALAHVHAQAGETDAAQAEEKQVALLSGATALAASGSGEATEVETAAPAGREFAALVGTFPLTQPDRRPIARVAWLGLAEPTDWRARLRAWVMPKAVDPLALDTALRDALAGRFQIAPERPVPVAAQPSLDALRALGAERGDVALVNDVLGVDASFVARYVPADAALLAPPGAPIGFELRLLGGRQTGEVFLLVSQAALADATDYVRWNRRAGLVFGVLAVLLLVPLVRGWGSISVVLDYERARGSQGFFSIELSRRPGRTKQEKQGENRNKRARYQRRGRSWSRFARHMVGRETRMRLLPARSWYVAVHGLLQDTTNQEVIGNYLEERKVRVLRGKCVEVTFDFRRKAAPIEVRLHREEKAAPVTARVAVLGAPDSLRFVKDDAVTVFVGTGTHTLLVGVEDRVFECKIEVRDMSGQALHVQVGNVEAALFSGCASAVDAYLAGDLLRASEALERAGKHEVATVVRATHHHMRGETAEAARCLEKAGKFGEAAELTKQSAQKDRSADLFERAGDFRQAAEQFALAGDPLKAAQAYEAGFEYAAAIDSYRAAGVHDKALELLEKTGRFFEAGALALERADEERAIRCFQQVGVREAEYADACEALAGLFEKRGALDLAVEKAREAIEAKGADEAPLDALEGLARLLERASRPAEALAIWENIRKRDFQYQGATERVEALRQTVAASARAATPAPAPLAASAPVATPGSEARYEVLGELGRGGMGVVLRAKDTRLGRVVALKRLPENLRSNATAVQLFLREARAAAALSHPNIVTLFDADQQADGTPYLTMELLEGFPLDRVLQRRGKLSVRDTLRLGVQIAKGLQFAHEKGIVHRDVKTANVFFTKGRTVKIMDFGLAKMTEEVRRTATVIGGTPYYMAPEQAAGETVDHRADLYALGVTLFELVTGSVPFKEGDVAHHHRHTLPPDARSRAPEVPEGLAELIQKLMAKTPDQRPATTAEVVRTLEKLLAEQSHAGL